MVRNLLIKSIALVVTLTVTSPIVQAQEKPWKVVGEGSGTEGFSLSGEDSPFEVTGNSSLLGRYSGDGVAKAISFNPKTLSGTFHGTYTFVAANGDELATTFGADEPGRLGEYFAIPAEDGLARIMFVAEFNPVPNESTGRFEKVTDGSIVLVAISEPIIPVPDDEGFTPPFSFDWSGKGSLEFSKGKGKKKKKK